MATDWSKLTVAQLKEELSKNNLDTSGKKCDLVSRMTTFSQSTMQAQEETKETSQTTEAEPQAETEQVTEGQSEDIADDDDKVLEGDNDDENEAKDSEPMDEGSEQVTSTEGAAEEETAAVEGENGKEDEEEGKDGGDEAEDSLLEAELGKEGEESETKTDAPGSELESDPNYVVLKWTDDQLVVVPINEAIKDDVLSETQCCSVVVFPVNVADLQSPAVVALMEKCLHFSVDFKSSWSTTEKTNEGYVDLLFGSYDDAKAATEEVGAVREGVEIKHMAHNDSRADLFQEWKRKFSENSLLSRLLYVGNIPEDTTEAQLSELFPGSLRAILAHKENREPRGYGYVEFASEEEVKEVLDKKADVEIGERKLYILKCLKERPEGLLTDKERDEIVRKVRGIRTHLKYNGRNMRRDEHMYQKSLQTRMLEQLRIDTKVRRENSLLNPEQLKKLELREERYFSQLAEAKSEGRRLNPGSSPYRGGRGGYQPRGQGFSPRGRGGQPWVQRGGPQGGYRGDRGGRGGNWRGGGRGWGGEQRGRQGEMAVAMDLLNNLSHALHSPGPANRYGDNSWRGGYGNQGGGNWGGNKRRASDEGFSDWKRRGGGGDRGRRGGGGGFRGRGNWSNY